MPIDIELYAAPMDEPPPRASWWGRIQNWLAGRESPPALVSGRVELPWQYRWEHLPKRTAGVGFTTRDYKDARQRAEAACCRRLCLAPYPK